MTSRHFSLVKQKLEYVVDLFNAISDGIVGALWEWMRGVSSFLRALGKWCDHGDLSHIDKHFCMCWIGSRKKCNKSQLSCAI